MTDSADMASRALDQVTSYVARQPGVSGALTPIPRLTVWSSTHSTLPTGAVFQPIFNAVLRGTKVLKIAGRQHELNAGDCAASSFGLPYVSQVVGGTPALPYVAVSLALDTDLLLKVMLDMPKLDERRVCSASEASLEDR